MMNADRLRGPKLRMNRANQHINDIHSALDTFLSSDLTTLIEEPHPDGRHKIIKLRLLRTLPDEIAILVGDAVSCLRSALDQLAVALARLNGATAVNDVLFPIAGSIEEFQRPGTQAKIRKLSQAAIDLIAAQKPYKGGDDFLWSLNKLRTTDFHQEIIRLTADTMPLMDPATTPFDWRRSVNEGVTFSFGGFPWDAANNGKDVAIVPLDVDMNEKISVAVDVVFSEPDTLEGMPILGALYTFRSRVNRVVATFEKGFF